MQYRKHPRMSTSRARALINGSVASGLPIPTMTAIPPDFVNCTAILIDCSAPLHSIVTSGCPPINDIIWSMMASSLSHGFILRAWSAPSFFAILNLYSEMSKRNACKVLLKLFFGTCLPVIMIFDAPKAFAVARVTKPIGPLPRITRLVPNLTFPFLQACTPTDSGSSNAPSSSDTWFGSLNKKKIIVMGADLFFSLQLLIRITTIYKLLKLW